MSFNQKKPWTARIGASKTSPYQTSFGIKDANKSMDLYDDRATSGQSN